MQRSLDLLALTKRLEMISTKPAVGRHFFRRFEFKGEKRRRSQAFYTGTSCLSSLGMQWLYARQPGTAVFKRLNARQSEIFTEFLRKPYLNLLTKEYSNFIWK